MPCNRTCTPTAARRTPRGGGLPVCWRLLGDRAAAEDAAQEAFIRAFDRLETFDPERPFGPWIRKVATNWCLNRLAATRPSEPLADDDERGPVGPVADQPEPAQLGRERDNAVRAALRSLPEKHRAVVELRHFQDMSYGDIAAALSLPVSDIEEAICSGRAGCWPSASVICATRPRWTFMILCPTMTLIGCGPKPTVS